MARPRLPFIRPRWLAGLAALAALGGLALSAASLAVNAYARRLELPSRIGSFPANRERVAAAASGEEWSFGFVADPASAGTFEALAAALRPLDLDFLVIGGDFCLHGREDHHAYFRYRLLASYRFPFPVFIMPGNHDLDERDFPVARFEEVYGPTLWTLEHRGSLFVFLRVLDGAYTNEESIRLLEELAAGGARARYGKIFVFQHTPAKAAAELHGRRYRNQDRVLAALRRLRPDYVLSGDHHGYRRVEQDGTVYLVAGGGGSKLKARGFGRFHHGLVLHFGPEGVAERLYAVDRNEKPLRRLERFAVATLAPWLRRRPLLAGALHLAALGLLAAGLAGLCRRRPGLPPGPPP